MLKNLKQKQEGFTIIEVMIVLVIAAVILLIVFLAVPALQRNSRNTQRKNEAARILGAASEWSSNHNGTAPAAATVSEVQALADTKTFTTVALSGAATTTTAVLNVDRNCNAAGNAVGATTTRSYALLYQVETNGGTTTVCTASGY